MYHQFNKAIAERYGIHAALVMEVIKEEIYENELHQKCAAKGQIWMRCSQKSFTATLPYLYPYLCAYYTSNVILGEYSECMVGVDYVEMVEMFAERVKEQCNKHREEQAKITVPKEQITADMCHPIHKTESLENKVAAVKTSALCPEYRTATHQLVYVTGGNGARANSFGNACYCKNLYSGKSIRWERYDIQGEVKPECLPDWAKERLTAIQKEQRTKGESEPKKENNEKER